MIVKDIRPKTRTKKRKAARSYGTSLFTYFIRADAESEQALKRFERDSAHDRARDIGGYFVDRSEEAVRSTGSKNLVGETPTEQLAEIQESIENASGDEVGVQHLVVSRRSDEAGKDEDFSQTVETLVQGLGAERCLIFWAVHSDTDNAHAHVMIVWLDHETGDKVAQKPWSIRAAHAAIAVAQRDLGWKPEPNALYQVEGETIIDRSGHPAGKVQDPASWAKRRPQRSQGDSCVFRPDKHQLEYEQTTGLMCRTRILHEVAAPILDQAARDGSDISVVVDRLAKEGIGLKRTRTGAVFQISGKPVNASTVRRWSCARIEATFGAMPMAPIQEVRDRVERFELHGPGDPKREYYRQKRAYDAKASLAGRQYAAPAYRAFRGGDTGGRLKDAAALCVFPDYEAWLSGGSGSLPDPEEVYCQRLQVSWFRSRKKVSWRSRQLQALPECDAYHLGGKTVCFGRDSPGRHVLTDTGSAFLLQGANDERLMFNILLLLHLRGADHVEATGLSRKDAEVARRVAERVGVELEIRRKPELAVGPNLAKGQSSHADMTPQARLLRRQEALKRTQVGLHRPLEEPKEAIAQNVSEVSSPADVRRGSTRIGGLATQRQDPASTGSHTKASTSVAGFVPVDTKVEASQAVAVPERMREWKGTAEAYQALLETDADRAHLQAARRKRDMRAWALRNAVRRGEIDRGLFDHGSWARMEKQAVDHENRQRQLGLGPGIAM